MADLQAKIWSLESEKSILNEKLKKLVESKERKNAHLTSVKLQISQLLVDLQPLSHLTYH
jgi:predicted nuclease with TOPRIM domain